jgi:serine/threonine protein kinase
MGLNTPAVESHVGDNELLENLLRSGDLLNSKHGVKLEEYFIERSVGSLASDMFVYGPHVENLRLLKSIPIIARVSQFGVLGSGNSSHVFRVQVPHSKRYLALKIAVYSDGSRGELELLTKMKHPNIVRTYSSTTIPQDNVTAVVFLQELCRMDLTTVCEGHHDKMKIPLVELLGYLCSITSALSYLHENDIVHRDIKAENVLISYNREAKLCDFGFSVSNGTVDRPKGTIMSIAPELAKAGHILQTVDKSQDVWSWGILLVECVFWTFPHPARLRNENARSLSWKLAELTEKPHAYSPLKYLPDPTHLVMNLRKDVNCDRNFQDTLVSALHTIRNAVHSSLKVQPKNRVSMHQLSEVMNAVHGKLKELGDDMLVPMDYSHLPNCIYCDWTSCKN